MKRKRDDIEGLLKIIVYSWVFTILLFVLCMAAFVSWIGKIENRIEDLENKPSKPATVNTEKPHAIHRSFSPSVEAVKISEPVATTPVEHDSFQQPTTEQAVQAQPEREKEYRTDPNSGNPQWRYAGDKIWGDV